MRVIDGASRLLTRGEPATANAYLGLIAVTGLVGWGATAAVHRLGGHPVGLTDAFWAVTGLWVALFVGRLLLGWRAVEDGALDSLPSLLWISLCVLALLGSTGAVVSAGPDTLGAAASGTGHHTGAGHAHAHTHGADHGPGQDGGLVAGVVHGPAHVLVVVPWALVFALGYLLTGVLADRGAVYLLAGLASLAVAWAALSVSLPAPFVALGALQVVPTGLDAARGGRQLTADGVPALRADTGEPVGSTA